MGQLRFGLWPIASHEVGHYLGLKHTFTPNDNRYPGEDEPWCPPRSRPYCHMTGDLICDTHPEGLVHHFGCSSARECGGPDPLNNYMSYASSCRSVFTPEQVRRMRCSLSAYRRNVYSITPMPPAPPPSSSPAPAPLESISMTECVCKETWSVGEVCRNQNGCRASTPECQSLSGRGEGVEWCVVWNPGCRTDQGGGWATCDARWPLGACVDNLVWRTTYQAQSYNCHWFSVNGCDGVNAPQIDIGQYANCPLDARVRASRSASLRRGCAHASRRRRQGLRPSRPEWRRQIHHCRRHLRHHAHRRQPSPSLAALGTLPSTAAARQSLAITAPSSLRAASDASVNPPFAPGQMPPCPPLTPPPALPSPMLPPPFLPSPPAVPPF